MKILVTGATGFIGERYLTHLSAAQPQCKLYFCGRNLQKGNDIAKRVGAHFFRGDLTDIPFVQLICKGMDMVVHCAGMSGIWGDYADYYQANVIVTENLLQAANGAGVRRFINIGSPSIYFDGKHHWNINEDFLPKRFMDNYARTKYQAEVRVMRAHCEQMKTLSLRPRLVIGVGDQTVLPSLIKSHQRGRLMKVGEADNVISMTSIHNLMQAMDCAVFGCDEITGDAYNIADPEPVKLWHLVDFLMSELKLPEVSGCISYPLAYALGSINEAWYRCRRSRVAPGMMRFTVAFLTCSFTLDLEKSRRKLGYRPEPLLMPTVEQFSSWWNTRLEDCYSP